MTQRGPDSVDFARLGEVFDVARELPPDQSEAYLVQVAAMEPALAQQVRVLLAADMERGSTGDPMSDAAIEGARHRLEAIAASGGITPQREAENEPTHIGRYRLLEPLGEGGFGVVYLAEQTQPVRRQVALKVIKLGMDTRQVVARFEAERQALALMDHPNIAKVFDGGATDRGRPYFVMELVRGLPITEYCDEHRLSIPQRLELVSMVCDALQHAHQKGVIHRDIKPSNVIVSAADSKAVPKIIDFGIAKATHASLTEKTIATQQRQMIGTPEYMSPEQSGEASQDVDTRTDVYSVGVLLYELLVGQTPFESRRLRSASFGEMQRIIREEDPPKPSTRLAKTVESLAAVADKRAMIPAHLRDTIRGDLDWIVMKALEKDRTRRYDSAGAMARDIQRYLTGHPVQAAPPGKLYLTRKFVGRNRGPVIAGALVLTALIVGLLGTSMGFLNANLQRKRADEKADEAILQKQRADTKASEAMAAVSLANRRAYSASMMSASTAISGVQFNSARTFLEDAPQELRGWEWGVLNARLDTSIRALKTTDYAGRLSELVAAPDGRSFLTWGGTVPSVQRWDALTGMLIRTVSPFASAAATVGLRSWRTSVSADQRLLFAAYMSDIDALAVHLETWDLQTGEQVASADWRASFDGMSVHAISADGSRMYLVSKDQMYVHRAATGELIAARELATASRNVKLNSNATQLLWSDPENIIHTADAQTLEPMGTFAGHSGMLMDIVCSSDNHWLGSAADDDSARVWDLRAQPPTSIVLQHPNRVDTIRFSPDASLVATFGRDRALRVWDRATGTLRATYPSEEQVNSPPMFMPDGKTIAGHEAAGTVRIWDVTAEETTILRGHVGTVSDVRFVPGNPAGIIISCGWDGVRGAKGIIRFWDADSGDLVGVHAGRPGDLVDSLATSRDGLFAAVSIRNPERNRVRPLPGSEASEDSARDRTEVIDLKSGELVYSVPQTRHRAWVTFASDDRSVILASRELGSTEPFRLQLLDARTGETLRTRELGPETLWEHAPHPDGRTLAVVPRAERLEAANRTTRVLVLDSQTLGTVRELDGIADGQGVIAFSPDGTRFAVGGLDGTLRVYEYDTGELLASLAGHGMAIMAAAFSPDGRRMASGGLDRKVLIWDASTYDQLAAFGGHEGHIGCIDWDATGHRLVSCSGDSTVRIWEPAPIRTRVQAREARRAALDEARPLVNKLFEELHLATKVVERIEADPMLTPAVRKAALQIVLSIGLDRQQGR